MSDPKQYRILSLDGGGSWALIQVKTLMEIYGDDTHGHEVLSHFDLVAANSGGSIVAAALLANLSLSEILSNFLDNTKRRAIFAPLPWPERLIHTLLRWLAQCPYCPNIPYPQFSTLKKLQGLRGVLACKGAKQMQALDCLKIMGYNQQPIKTLITAYDFDRDRAKFFRSWASPTSSLPNAASAASLAQAVHASSNAPIEYFNQPAYVQGTQYWDGAIAGYNNPVLAAVTEAIANGQAREHIKVLSIGSGTTMLPLLSARNNQEALVLFEKPQASGMFANIRKISRSILSDPPDAHSFIAHVMLGGGLPTTPCSPAPSNIVRFNPLIQPDGNSVTGWQLPSGLTNKDFARLVELDLAAVEDKDVRLIQQFCKLWMEDKIPNQAIRADSDFSCEIGHDKFSKARAACLALDFNHRSFPAAYKLA